ncbi:MAG: amidohydrolase, partial [Proteobacteria bacterium]|nr:amidohydrolase [Pseudomonadota bacterium]
MRAALLAAAAVLLPVPALADALIDNVQGITLDRDGRVVRFKALVMDKDGKVVRLVPVNEEPRKPTKKDPGPRYDWRADMKG